VKLLRSILLAAGAALLAASTAAAQTNSGALNGTVTDATGAVIPGATVTLANSVSGYTRTQTSDSAGHFQFTNVPLNPYQLSVTMSGFQAVSQRVDINSIVPTTLPVKLPVATSSTTVNVEAPIDLTEQDPNAHTDIDRSAISSLPVESASSQLSSIVTELSPGVAADSDGQMHGLGDHAENSFNIDGQPITDQQSKVFSNQVPAAAIQSLEVIEGAPPAEYGDKTSLVVVATTRSGQGIATPTGSVTASYGTFGSSSLGFDLAYGGASWGNFIASNAMNTGRFLDTPEFNVLHDKGNEENFFDRIDLQPSEKNSFHINLQYTRSWFQTPDDFENLNLADQNGNPVGNTDQRSKIQTIDVAPTYTRTVSPSSVANLGFYFRRDGYNYFPSRNPFADYALDQQQETVSQARSLTNVGTHADISYVHGINNAKFGGMYQQTFLRENDGLGVVDPSLNAPCLDASGNPVNHVSDPACTGIGETPNPSFLPVLAPYDLTRGGSIYTFLGRTDVKQLALYGEDQMNLGNWLLNFGVRGDFYNGLTIQREAEPRAGVSYSIKKTATVLRASYARTQETPFNENLVLSSTGCADPVLIAVFTLTSGSCASNAVTPFNPGFRNEFHAGLQQAAGRHFVFSGEYIWKYTHNAYDFSVLGTTPITFPIEWHNSKIPGYALSATLTDVKGLTARFNASSVSARFFTPQIGGVGAVPSSTSGVNQITPFRIDHDERFNQTTNLEYKLPFRKSVWYGFTWRSDSGMVAGAAPCYNADPSANTDCLPFSLAANGSPLTLNGQPLINLSRLSPDQQFQAGLTCNGVKATTGSGFQQCLASQLSSRLINIPAPNTENADRNPTRIAPRNAFDMAAGDDNLAHFGASERYKLGVRLTAINVANKYALYNFLSTFSGTHYLTPRTVTAELDLHF
jgi:hypothetical protein